MTHEPKHAALPYPPPDPNVTVAIVRHHTRQIVDTDELTGKVEELTTTDMRIEASNNGRIDRYHVDSFSGITLWHDKGNGSSSSLQHPDTANIPEIVRRHSAQDEDPCDSYGTAWVLGADLTAKVHLRPNWGTQTLCGRDTPTATRVLRRTVNDEQWCQSCERAL